METSALEQLYGDDDGFEYFKHLGSRDVAFVEVIRQAESETRPQMKLALLDVAESITRGEGAQIAFRNIRRASHS